MDSQKVDLFIIANGKYFESTHVVQIRDHLKSIDESKWDIIQTLQFKDPTTMLIISIFAGQLGIDRFVIGDTGMGIGKLLTCGGFGIWAIIDFFMIMGATRMKNIEKIEQALNIKIAQE